MDRYIRETWGLTIGGVVRLARGSSEDERGSFDTFYHMLLSVFWVWRSVLSTLAKGCPFSPISGDILSQCSALRFAPYATDYMGYLLSDVLLSVVGVLFVWGYCL